MAEEEQTEMSEQEKPCCSGCVDMEHFLEVMMRNTHNCTHTHTCNPPTGPDNKHTHTCYHTHTQLFAPSDGGAELLHHDASPSLDTDPEPAAKKKRPVGNREAVKKYREKKKAQAAQLEVQVQRLKLLQAQLFKRLQGQEVLQAEVLRLRPFEAEALRLRSALAEFRGRIDGELGIYHVHPHHHAQQKAVQEGFQLNAFAVPCDAEPQCLQRAGNVGGRSSGRL